MLTEISIARNSFHTWEGPWHFKKSGISLRCPGIFSSPRNGDVIPKIIIITIITIMKIIMIQKVITVIVAIMMIRKVLVMMIVIKAMTEVIFYLFKLY